MGVEERFTRFLDRKKKFLEIQTISAENHFVLKIENNFGAFDLFQLKSDVRIFNREDTNPELIKVSMSTSRFASCVVNFY